jgi:hypothetical protein
MSDDPDIMGDIVRFPEYMVVHPLQDVTGLIAHAQHKGGMDQPRSVWRSGVQRGIDPELVQDPVQVRHQ